MNAEELYFKLKNIKLGGSFCQFSLRKCEEILPLVNEINEIKKEKNAVILAHTYVSPEILYGVADFIGDSYGLSKDACNTDAQTIVFSAVRFMGETAKILNPDKEVLLPSNYDGCDLADSITGEQVKELRKQYPDHTFVCYVNTTCAVKAECDVCVTSSNIYKVVTNLPNDKIFFLPDQLMGLNLIEYLKQKDIKKDVKIYSGCCSIHKNYAPEELFRVKSEYPDVKVVSHPECRPEICKESDFVGSTAQMLDYMHKAQGRHFVMLTECGLSARLKAELPDKQLVGMCTLCPFMKSNKLEDILRVLKNPSDKDRVVLDEDIRQRAKKCLDAMFQYTETQKVNT